MNFSELFVSALTLKTQTFVALRERSDVFLRGFVVLLCASLVAGLFIALDGTVREFLPPPSKEAIIRQAVGNFQNSYNGPPELQPVIESYIREGVSMVYELFGLPPRAGEGARPVAAVLNYIGNVLATPFSWTFAGWMLFAGLLFQFSSRLLGGRASINQMLGLTALAAAPQIFASLTSLLNLIATVGNAPLLSGVNGVLGFVLAIWSAVVYVKATSVAQNFSLARSVGAIALGIGILIGVMIIAVVFFAVVVGGVVGAVVGQAR